MCDRDCRESFDGLGAAAASGTAPAGWARVHSSAWKGGSKVEHECLLDEPVAIAAGRTRGFYYYAKDNNCGCCFETTPSSRRDAKINASDPNLTIQTVSFIFLHVSLSSFLFLLYLFSLKSGT